MSSAGVDAGVVPPWTGTSPLRWSLPPSRRHARPPQRPAEICWSFRAGVCRPACLSAPLGTRSLRTHYFAPDGRQRPGETPVRIALSPRLLIRMRSQVQVLAGPPPIPAGQSAAGSETGAAHLAPQPAPLPAAQPQRRVLRPTRELGSVAHPRPPRPSTEPPTARPPTATSPVPVVTVAPPPRPGPDRQRLRWDQTDASGRVDSGRPARRTPWTTQVTGHRTAGHRTAGQPDPGRQNGWVDTACWPRTVRRRRGWFKC
jgi:hypothetical protein